MPRIGIGPGVVEHELTVGIGLQVAGNGADQGITVPEGEVPRLPAPVLAQAAVGFQAGQESVADERVAAVVQGIPVGGGNGLQGVEEAGAGHELRLEQIRVETLAVVAIGPKAKMDGAVDFAAASSNGACRVRHRSVGFLMNAILG
ncbi:hypothetical protein D3C71_1231720 [compost metagenome]